jgi:hypothetical protein
MSLWASVDPGLKTGLAVWDDKARSPKFLKSISLPGYEKNWYCHARDTAEEVRYWLCAEAVYEGDCPDRVFIEAPAYHPSLAGQAVAAGSLVKLSIYVGMLAGVCEESDISVTLVPIRQWKGNAPKSVTNKRTMAELGSRYLARESQDVLDAVGLGLWVKRNLR